MDHNTDEIYCGLIFRCALAELMSKVIEVEGVTVVLTVLATILVALRCISRFGLLKKSLIDDYLVLFAVILSWSLTGLIYARKLDHFHAASTFANGSVQRSHTDLDKSIVIRLSTMISGTCTMCVARTTIITGTILMYENSSASSIYLSTISPLL